MAERIPLVFGYDDGSPVSLDEMPPTDTIPLANLPSVFVPITAKTTILTVTGQIAAGTNFSVTSSGANYTMSGDAGDLLASAALFNAAASISVFLNGAYLTKSTDVTWQSSTTFQLNVIVDNGDEIIILS